MAKIHIENGIISSSADYGLYHGTSEIAKVEAGGLRVQGDVTAENLIVSSSVTFMTQSFSSGSTIFGDTLDDTHQMTGSVKITGSFNLKGSDGGTALFEGNGGQVTLNLSPNGSNNNYIVANSNA